MGTEARKQLSNAEIIEAAARGELSEAQIRSLEPKLAQLALIAAMQVIEQLREGGRAEPAVTPSTPSGQQPIYTKPKRRKKRGRKRGAKLGHIGHRRPAAEQIDRREEHAPLSRCPHCNKPVHPPGKHRRRVIIDLPEDLCTEATEHVIPRQWCGGCKKYVEPTVADAMPKATIGHRAVATTAWFHYGLGITISQVVSIFGRHLNTRLSPGGLVSMWRRLASELEPWYEQIGAEARRSAVLHADETGWRVDGLTHWLWCFANKHCCYYMIDHSRGSPALRKFFKEDFDGVLITDFWRAYEQVNAAQRQYCLVHLLREIEKVNEHNDRAEWHAFAKKLKRLIRDGIRLRRRSERPNVEHPSRVKLIDQRLNVMADGAYDDADTRRLANRLSRHRDWLFTFLDYPDVPFENNFAERQIRPAVILRKNSQSNRSDQGAATQAILMSVCRTLELRDKNPLDAIAQAMRTRLLVGQLPPLPAPTVADG